MPFPCLAIGDEHPPGYRITEVPAAGSPTRLYPVEHVGTRRPCTLQLFPALPDDASEHETERFLANVRASAKAVSGHIPTPLDAGVTDRVPWIVMSPGLAGEDLGQLVARRGRLPFFDTAVPMLRALQRAFAAARPWGLVHGGLEPGVIFVGPSGPLDGSLSTQLIGFGLARYRDGLGTLASAYRAPPGPAPSWLAPEQIRGHTPSAATDVWALGLLVFWMLTGKSFWAQEGFAERVQEILADPLPVASARAAALGTWALPEGFDAWFAQCMSQDPAARYESVEQALGGLVPAEASHALQGNPAPSLYDAGLKQVADDREATDRDGTGGYRHSGRKLPDDTMLRANPKGSYYDRGLRDPRRWPPFIVLALVVIGVSVRFCHP